MKKNRLTRRVTKDNKTILHNYEQSNINWEYN
jgi:hypothetical protein